MKENNELQIAGSKFKLNTKGYSFKQKTNWVVITGGPCSGKTSVISTLKESGFSTSEEVARSYIEEQIKLGHPLPLIRSEPVKLQLGILSRIQALEAETPHHKLHFFDRGVPDGLAYFRLNGIDPNILLESCYNNFYNKIFVLDQLDFQSDEVRDENMEMAKFLHHWNIKNYQDIGYEIIHVPAIPVLERVEFIKSYIKE